eukprot:TRINITY_DN5709_c0_g1_i1.p1 TRINITY_DN5709_c0_g1~~TRINITY_DN5709_c0_g1_i1.p1  ORF type:complete len:616 (+),score=234.20 TRINITY_DN5709_c0_g1_i1:76-1848(+)
MLTVCVASDVHGSKINLEFPFPVQPSMAEFHRQVELAFAQEVADRKPPEAPPGFRVTRFQLYDEQQSRWVDFQSPSQLFDYCQLYAFQPPGPWHKEVQAAIPHPVRARLPVPALSAPSVHAAVTPTPRRDYGDPYGSVGRAAAAAEPIPLMPENATHDEKVRSTFEELDVNGNRVIELDELRRGFQLVNLSEASDPSRDAEGGAAFSAATVEDLFGKADVNKDMVIQFAEWQRFTELYPTVLDSLYFRFRAYWEDRRAQEEGRALEEQARAMREAQAAARRAYEDARKESAAQNQQLQGQEAALAGAMKKQRQAEEVSRECARNVDRATKEVSQADSDLQLQREKERQKQTAFTEAQRDTANSQRRCAAADSERARADDCHRQTQQLFAEAKVEVERQHALTDSARRDREAAARRQQEVEAARALALRQVEEAQQRLAQADEECARRAQAVREREMDHHAAVQATQRASQHRQDEERCLLEQRDKEQGLNMDRLQADRAVQEQAQTLQRLRQENDDFNRKRKELEDQEQPLIEQEVRLREQRDNLEQKESRLRTDHRSFYESAWKGGGDQASPRRTQQSPVHLGGSRGGW